MKVSERQHQICVVDFLRMHPEKPLFYAIPNGGSRNKIEAANLKKEGVVAGVSDLFIAEPRHGFHGFYIEMKAKGGRVTEKQRQFLKRASKNGYEIAVCYGADDAIDLIKEYLDGR